jgi:hypothetical protein
MNADIRFPRGIEIDRIHRACRGTLTAADTELLTYENAAAFPLGIGAGGTGRSARGRVTGKAGLRLKSAREPAGRHDPDARRIPGKKFVDNARACQGARVASDAAFHPVGYENFHSRSLIRLIRSCMMMKE